jgi:hypothetical protein
MLRHDVMRSSGAVNFFYGHEVVCLRLFPAIGA